MNLEKMTMEELVFEQRKLQLEIARLNKLFQENGLEVEKRMQEHERKIAEKERSNGELKTV